MMTLRLYLLGYPRLELGGAPVEVDRSKALALLVYLARQKQPVSREALATLFWPENDRASALAYLRRTLWSLKQALGDSWLAVDRETIGLPSDPPLWMDIEQFEALLAECESHSHPAGQICLSCLETLDQAVALYQADFLAGFNLGDSPDFDDWQFFEAESLRRALAGALDRLVSGLSQQGEWEAAISHARRWLALDPLDENVQRRLMQLYAQAGQRNAALRQYQECARLLEAELGVPPQAETEALYRQILANQVEASPPPPAKLAEAGPAEPPVNFPLPATGFVGRESELEKIWERLSAPDCRLLSICGPGGIGKTRLALQAAAQEAAARPTRFPGGIYFVPLAPLTSPGLLLQAIADALDFEFRQETVFGRDQGSQIGQLGDYLRRKQVLLVLDNFEHLVEAADCLEQLLAHSTSFKMIVTSRERLNLPAEWTLEIQGLPYPGDPAGKDWREFGAVRLFLESARRSRADFDPGEAAAGEIVRICQLVDGVPLGLELAAAWVRLLSPREIASEIAASLDFLGTPRRGVQARHNSLRAVFEHSWRLLAPQEQSVFRGLAVFQGSFTRQAATQIAGATMPLLAGLMDKSLLRRRAEDCYELHPLLKQYAAEQLAASQDEQTRLLERHTGYYLAMLADMDDTLRGPEQLPALAQLSDNLEDVRAVWRRLILQDRFAEIKGSAPVLLLFYFILGRSREADEDFSVAVEVLRRRWEDFTASPVPEGFRAALGFVMACYCAVCQDLEKTDLAKELFAESQQLAAELPPLEWAWIDLIVGFELEPSPEVAARRYERLQSVLEQAGERWYLAMAQIFYAYALDAHEPERSRELFASSMATMQAQGDRWGAAIAQQGLAHLLYYLGEYEEGQYHARQSLDVFREFTGETWRVISNLLRLGQLATAVGEYRQAIVYYQESLAHTRRLGNNSLLAAHLASLGHTHYLLGEYVEAQSIFEESLVAAQEAGDESEVGMAYGNLGNVARAQGAWVTAHDHYLRSVAHLRQEGEKWGLGLNLKRLGGLCIDTGKTTAAWRNLRAALDIAIELELPAEVFDILVNIARLLLEAGDQVRAAELLAYVLMRPATTMEVRETAMQHLAALDEMMLPEELQAALERGRSQEQDQVLQGVFEASAPYL